MKLIMENWKKYLKDLVVYNPVTKWLEDNQPEFVRIQNFAISRTQYLYNWTQEGPQRQKILKKANMSKGTPDEERTMARLRDWDDNSYRGNAFRHMLTSLMIAHKSLGPEATNLAGYTKEIVDLIYKNLDFSFKTKTLTDSKVDIKNNQVGLELAEMLSHRDPSEMKDRDYVEAVLYRMSEGEFFLDPQQDPLGRDGELTNQAVVKYKDLVELRKKKIN